MILNTIFRFQKRNTHGNPEVLELDFGNYFSGGDTIAVGGGVFVRAADREFGEDHTIPEKYRRRV